MAPEVTSQEAPGKSRRTLLGKKLGMTQLYLESGQWVPVTVLQAGPCTVLQVKTPKTDGYSAVQLGFDATKKPRKRPQQARLDRLGILGQRFVREVPSVDPQHVQQAMPHAPPSAGSPPSSESPASSATHSSETPSSTEASPEAPPEATSVAAATPADPAETSPESQASESPAARSPAAGSEGAGKDAGANGPVAPGAVVGVSVFKDITHVDVRGRTKGRGFQGVIKRHHFNAGPKSRGTKNIRDCGSTGMHTDPARVLPGKKMPGHMGAVYRKARNLQVIRIDEAQNLLVVRGAVPGPTGGYVTIEESLRG